MRSYGRPRKLLIRLYIRVGAAAIYGFAGADSCRYGGASLLALSDVMLRLVESSGYSWHAYAWTSGM